MDHEEIRAARERMFEAQQINAEDAQLLLEFARRVVILTKDSFEPGLDERVPIDRIRDACLETLREDLPGWLVAQACMSEGVDVDLILHTPEP